MRLDLSGVIQIQFSFMLVTISPLILLNFRGNQLCNRIQNIEVICTCHRQEYDLGVLCGAGKSFERGCVAPDAPSLRVARAKEKEVAPDGSRLDWMYDRRSQFIHSRIVPKGVIDGIPYFNFRLFDNKNTNWSSKYESEALVETKYPELWREFLTLIGEQWETLRSRLRAREEIKIQELKIPNIDFSNLRPQDIRITGGPVPPSAILWNFPTIPPSGTL